jgi:hypothetical protein
MPFEWAGFPGKRMGIENSAPVPVEIETQNLLGHSEKCLVEWGGHFEEIFRCAFEMCIVWAYTQGKRTRTEAAAAVPVVGIKKSPKRQKKQCAPYVPQSAVTILRPSVTFQLKIWSKYYSTGVHSSGNTTTCVISWSPTLGLGL